MANHIPNCKTCGTPGVREERYDAYYCALCVVWIDPQCGDEECEFCTRRPEYPALSRAPQNKV